MFAYKPKSWETESYVVIYAPAYGTEDAAARTNTQDSIAKLSATLTSARPFQILPLLVEFVSKSSLGKMPRLKLRYVFERGEFASIAAANNRIVTDYKAKTRQACSNPPNILIAEGCSELLDIPLEGIGEESSIFDLGATSVTIFAIKKRIQDKLFIRDIPMAAFLLDPTIRNISHAIDTFKSAPSTYDPVVPLQQRGGNKTPLWFIHPGFGDVLVFIAIAKYFPDRSIYGLRTRGFTAGKDFFSTIHEAVNIYYVRIKNIQPSGPYALAGY
jgi:hypothetical protein